MQDIIDVTLTLTFRHCALSCARDIAACAWRTQRFARPAAQGPYLGHSLTRHDLHLLECRGMALNGLLPLVAVEPEKLASLVARDDRCDAKAVWVQKRHLAKVVARAKNFLALAVRDGGVAPASRH